MNKGLLVHRVKPDYDCTNGGISSTHDQFILIGEEVPGVFEPHEKTPALKLVKRIIFGKEYIHAEPLNEPEGIGWMFGGNFIYSSDSRFPNKYPIPVHDRQESQELYDALSS